MILIFEFIDRNITELILGLCAVFVVCCWYLFAHKPLVRKLDRIDENLRNVLAAIADLRSQIYRIAENSQALRHENESIRINLEKLENRIINLSRLITNISSRVRNVSTGNQQSPEAPMSNKSSREALLSTVQQFCDLYNAVVTGKTSQTELFERYNRPLRIAVANTTDRRRNPSDRPVFEENTNGNFWAFHIDDENSYFVVPRYKLALQNSIYTAGAFNFVFECPDFDPVRTYRSMTVVRPASFKRDATPNEWILKEKGELELGPGT